jgi:hypothetical protein
MDVCYDSSYFRDTLHDQIGSEHVPVYVNERVSSRFWCDSCCMTKHDQISSGVSHRPITVQVSHRVEIMYFLYSFIFWIFKHFVTSDERGWGYARIWEMGVSMASFPPCVFGLNKADHSLLLIKHRNIFIFKKKCLYHFISFSFIF